jgi:signal transduction histidine kinase
MFRTLYARLAGVLVVLFLLTGLLYGLITTAVTERHLQEVTQHFNRNLAQRIVADRQLITGGQLDQSALKATFSAYMDINPSIEIYLLDVQGRILAFSADPGRVKRQRVALEPIKAFLAGEGFPLLGDDPRSHDRRKAFSVTRLPGESAGYLYVVLRGEEYDSVERAVQESYLVRLSGWSVAGSLGLGLLAGLLLFHLLTRRLQRLSNSMLGFQQNGFTRHESFLSDSGQRDDEIDRLGRVFDEMAQRIIAQWGELKEQDRLRRELVAQVSHDLRTPLAALHGYLETLQMKGEGLQSREREEYLAIALRQSERLQLMIEGLFELAQLEARETRPHCEATGLADLLQDVVQKFRLRAESAQIRLEMVSPRSLPVVMADIALTERVLDNLIGNAIDHTPANGRIVLTLEITGDQALVSISDTGPGIPDRDLPHLFDPFYRGSRTGGEGHAGLGLAIARRITELQGGALQAENRAQGGAKFTFTLPLYRA